MVLILNLTKGISDKFYDFVIFVLNDYCNTNIDLSRCKTIDNVLSSITDVPTELVIKLGFENLKYKKYSSKTIISIDLNIFTDDGINVEQLCTMINDGALDIRPYTIFDDAFNYIKNNLQAIWLSYVSSDYSLEK